MMEFEFRDNVLCLNIDQYKSTVHYSDFIREIYNCTYPYDIFERFLKYDQIDEELKEIMEPYNKKGLQLIEAPGSIYFIGSVMCNNKNIKNEVIEKLHAYVIMRKLMQ